MYSVILCGGSGTRLWPLSRNNYPKQFLKLYSDKSLLQETYLRARKLMSARDIFLVTDSNNSFTALHQIREIEPDFDSCQILIEPEKLGDAPALAYAIKHLYENLKINLDEPIISLNSDHYIEDLPVYLELMKTACKDMGDRIGIIGIKPDTPETGYGYIQKGERIGTYFLAKHFCEKPNKETAQKYLDSGEYVWNSGMYVFNAKTFMEEVRKHTPELHDKLQASFENYLKAYASIPLTGLASDIFEKTDNIAIFEGSFGWSDVGSFDILADIIKKDNNSQHINIDSKNVFVHSESNRLIATLGVEDINVIENIDSILIQKKGRSEDVKKVIAEMKKRGSKEIDHSLIVHRPWGKYELLIENHTHRVKKTTLLPGAKLNMQSHNHRSEHWIVIKGTAKIQIGGKESLLHENESTFIPPLTKHRMANPGKSDLEIIEVQTGQYLSEDDTITYNDQTKLPIDQMGFNSL